MLFILSDALRAANLPFYGYPRDTAPVLAQVAKESVVFRWHFAGMPFTRGSVSQMFTGLFFAPAMMASQHADDEVRPLSAGTLSLPKFLREHGYATTIVSGHPWFNESAPVRQQFERQHVLLSRSAYATFESLMPHVLETFDAAAADRRPFLLYLHVMETHHPNRLHAGLKDHVGDGRSHPRYDTYDSEIRLTDRWIGRVLDELERRGLAEKTLVVFTADHGDEFGEHGTGWSNHTHGANLRRGATHIPFLVRLPPSHRVRGSFEDVTSHIDVAPTVVRLAVPGADLGAYRLDGEDLSERVLAGEFEATRREVFASNDRYFALRRGDLPHLDAVYDQWSGKATLYAIEPDEHNAPRARRVSAKGRGAGLKRALERIARHPEKRFHMPNEGAERAPASGFYAPGTPVPARGAKTPDYSTRSEGRWGVRPGRYLRAEPGERPGPITLALWNGAGRYRVRIKLRAEKGRIELLNGFTFTLHVDPSVHKRFPPQKRKDPWLDVGEFDLPEAVRVTLDEPEGGVDIAGIRLDLVTREAASGEAPERDVDPALTEQLRALGYVE